MLNRTQAEVMQSWSERAGPVVSICCITYNHESYISQAIDSLLMQETDFPFEIIVHDDASTDGTTEIVLEYAGKYPNIIKPIIQTENQYTKGGLINLRFTFPKAKGEYVALCEGDDYWTDCTKLQKQVQFLEHHPEYVITYTDTQPFDDNGKVDVNFGGARRDLAAIELKKASPIFTLTTCFRNVIKEIPLDLMSARYGDLVMWSLLGHYGKGKYLSSIIPAAYRVHDDGVHSKKTSREKYEMAVITRAALYAYYMRRGDRELSLHFKSDVFIYSLRSIGAKGAAKLILKRIFKKLIA